jgi:hypothetical protein
VLWWWWSVSFGMANPAPFGVLMVGSSRWWSASGDGGDGHMVCVGVPRLVVDLRWFGRHGQRRASRQRRYTVAGG